jgi:hypothetical protein
MKKWNILFVLFLACFNLSAQDRIVTKSGAEINCRIVGITAHHIQFEQKAGSGIEGKFIPLDSVASYNRTDWSAEARPARKKVERPWSVGLNAGGSWMLSPGDFFAGTTSDLALSSKQTDDYNSDLRNAVHASANLHYMLSDRIGLGVRYSFFAASVKRNLNFAIPFYNYYYLSSSPYYEVFEVGVDQRDYVHFVCPSVILRMPLDKNGKFAVSGNLAPGYAFFRGECRLKLPDYFLTYDSETAEMYCNALMTGGNFAANVELGFEYFPVKWLSVGAYAGYFYSKIYKVDLSAMDDYEKIATETITLQPKYRLDLSRLDYSLGVRLHF